jgi:type IV pilus assembly protein PilQ
MKTTVILCTFLFILILGYWFDLYTRWNEFIALQKNERLYKQTISDMQKKIAPFPEIENRLAETTKMVIKLTDQFPEDFEIQNLLQFITKMANDCGVQIQLLKPLAQIKTSFYTELPFQLSIIGNYHQIALFISRITTLNKLISLHDFNLEHLTPSSPELKLDIILKTYCYIGNINKKISLKTPIGINLSQSHEYATSNFRDPFNHDLQKIPSNNDTFLFDTTKKPLLSINLQNIPVRSVLQKLAEFANINLVLSDRVVGNISLHLQNISWLQAKNIILSTKGLSERKIDNIYLIAPTEEIANLVQKEILANQRVSSLEPLKADVFHIEYANANDIVKLLHTASGNTILSERGSLSADERTNTIWLQDIQSKFTEIQHFIQELDVPTKQVLIEARIVSVDNVALKELGVRFGISTPSTDTLSNALQDNRNGFNIDLPVIGVGNASMGLALAKLGSGMLLDLELSALQSEGNVQIIASPHLITANQKEAMIQAGEDIPFQQTTPSGATSVEFKKAVLSLKVTPRITLDDHLQLTLIVNQDKRGADILQGVPAIDTQEITTQVLVNNKQTIVIGGIYRQDTDHHIKRIPFISDLPIIGHLFKYQKNNQRMRELLIFITPKIVKQSLDGS